jgi:hypothetical protein
MIFFTATASNSLIVVVFMLSSFLPVALLSMFLCSLSEVFYMPLPYNFFMSLEMCPTFFILMLFHIGFCWIFKQ